MRAGVRAANRAAGARAAPAFVARVHAEAPLQGREGCGRGPRCAVRRTAPTRRRTDGHRRLRVDRDRRRSRPRAPSSRRWCASRASAPIPTAATTCNASAEATAELLRAHGLETVRLAGVDGSHPYVDRRVDARRPRTRRPCFSMRITTCSRRASSRTGRATRSSPTNAAAGSSGAAPPTTRRARVAHAHAVSAWLRTAGALPCNVRVLIEGEEEIGSPTLQTFLHAHLDELRSDVLVLADAGQLGSRRPWAHVLAPRPRGRRHRAPRARRAAPLGHGGRRRARPVMALGTPARLPRRRARRRRDRRAFGRRRDSPADERVPIAGLDDDPEAFARAIGVRPGVQSGGRSRRRRCTSGCGCGRRSPSSASTVTRSRDRRTRSSPARRRALELRLGPGQDPERVMRQLRAHVERPCRGDSSAR